MCGYNLQMRNPAKIKEIKKAEWFGLIIIKKGKGILEVHSDILPEGETLILRGIKSYELISFLLGKDDSLKRLLLISLRNL
uniref:Uncharacterized protein n=1 Tax=Meloidogyne enterolobii TaxID=390850 RepID=A0A6V7W8J3_MELEN|nr:unnamed protein product [Meloidogyne enterolobii]